MELPLMNWRAEPANTPIVQPARLVLRSKLAGGTRRAPRLRPGRGCGPNQPDNFLPEIEPTNTRQRRLRALDCSRQPGVPSTHVQGHLDSAFALHYLHRTNGFSPDKIVSTMGTADVYGFAHEDLEGARKAIENALSIRLEGAQESMPPNGSY